MRWKASRRQTKKLPPVLLRPPPLWYIISPALNRLSLRNAPSLRAKMAKNLGSSCHWSKCSTNGDCGLTQNHPHTNQENCQPVAPLHRLPDPAMLSAARTSLDALEQIWREKNKRLERAADGGASRRPPLRELQTPPPRQAVGEG